MENEISTAALKQIFKYLTCHQVAQSRLVSTKFNIVGMSVLNEQFAKVSKDLTILVKKTLKCHLPRKSKNAMTRRQVILLTNSILLMLRAVFGRYIASLRCCFYPGLIIDYANKVIHKLKSDTPGGNFERITLKRLYICANRAMNHFELYIEPHIDGPLTFNGTKVLDYLSTCCHLQAVETERSTFFTKVCKMFPEGRPSTRKYRDNWLFKVRNEILVHNNLWVSEHMTSHNEPLQQEVDNHSDNESKNAVEEKIINNEVESTNVDKNQASSEIKKLYEKTSLSKYQIPSKDMMMKNLHYTIHNDQETNISIEPRKSSILDTSLEKVLAPPDFVMPSHKQQNEDLIRMMVNSNQLINDTYEEQFQANKKCVYELRSNKRKEVMDQPYIYKKYNFDPYLFKNNNGGEEEEHANKQNKDTQLYKQDGFLDNLSRFYQNHHDLEFHSYKNQYKTFTVEDAQLNKKLCDNRIPSQAENILFQYKKFHDTTYPYNSGTIPTITIDD